MKTSRFTDSQIIAIKQAEGGSPVPELCCEHGISDATFYKCRSKFGGMDASLMVCMKKLDHLKASIRAKVEYPLHIVKNLFRHQKTRCCRLAKNTVQLLTLFAFANLLLACRRFAITESRSPT